MGQHQDIQTSRPSGAAVTLPATGPRPMPMTAEMQAEMRSEALMTAHWVPGKNAVLKFEGPQNNVDQLKFENAAAVLDKLLDQNHVLGQPRIEDGFVKMKVGDGTGRNAILSIRVDDINRGAGKAYLHNLGGNGRPQGDSEVEWKTEPRAYWPALPGVDNVKLSSVFISALQNLEGQGKLFDITSRPFTEGEFIKMKVSKTGVGQVNDVLSIRASDLNGSSGTASLWTRDPRTGASTTSPVNWSAK